MPSGADENFQSGVGEAMRRALGHLQAGRAQEAAAQFRKVLEVEPNHPEALYMMGVVAFKSGRTDLATKFMARSVSIDPTNSGHQVNLGNVYLKLQQFDKAVECYRAAIVHNPGYASAYAYLGNALARQGDIPGSEAAIRRAIELRQQQHLPVPAEFLAPPTPPAEEPVQPVEPGEDVNAERPIEPEATDDTPATSETVTAPVSGAATTDSDFVTADEVVDAPAADESPSVELADEPFIESTSMEVPEAFVPAVQTVLHESVPIELPIPDPDAPGAGERETIADGSIPTASAELKTVIAEPVANDVSTIAPLRAAPAEPFSFKPDRADTDKIVAVEAVDTEMIHLADPPIEPAPSVSFSKPVDAEVEVRFVPAALPLGQEMRSELVQPGIEAEISRPLETPAGLPQEVPAAPTEDRPERRPGLRVRAGKKAGHKGRPKRTPPAKNIEPTPDQTEAPPPDPVVCAPPFDAPPAVIAAATLEAEPALPTEAAPLTSSELELPVDLVGTAKVTPPIEPPPSNVEPAPVSLPADSTAPRGLLGAAHAELLGEAPIDEEYPSIDPIGDEAIIWLTADGPPIDGMERADTDDASNASDPEEAETDVATEVACVPEEVTAARSRPPSAESLRRKGVEALMQRRLPEAIELLKRAVQSRPRFAAAHRDLGGALLRRGELTSAIASLKRALELKPSYAYAWGSLGDAYQLEGKISKAIRCYRRLLQLSPTSAKVHSNLLLSINYDKRPSATEVYEEHLKWARKHADPLGRCIQPHLNDRDPRRKLRVAYLSPDFRRHSVNYFIEPILSTHDREHFHVTCFSDVARPDVVTASLSTCVDAFVDVRRLSDEQLAQSVRAEQIDILVDLAGHTGNNRMGVFARKPSPVQVTYLGYPNTTGLSTIDYRITDAHADPPGRADKLHSEKLLRMPDSFLCYRPSAECPEVSPAPCLTSGYVTFGCFNVLAKLTSDVLVLWARLLAAIPKSRLILKGRAGAFGHERRRQYVRDAFVYHGVAADRIEMLPIEPTYAGHLALYSKIDIALDPFPYNGTTTTCEALWMGLPVVSLAGDRHVARVGLSILTATDLSDLIAWSTDQYVRIAAWLARDTPRLARIREGLRQKLLDSPLMDPARFTKALESHYRAVWEHWCQTGGVPEVHETMTLHDD